MFNIILNIFSLQTLFSSYIYILNFDILLKAFEHRSDQNLGSMLSIISKFSVIS